MGMLDQKTAIVTGGARGIGLAIAKRFVAEGARVVIADIDETAGKAAAASLGSAARFVRTDVGAAGDARNVVAEACGVRWRSRHPGEQCRHHPHGGFPRHRAKPTSTACCASI